MDNLNLKYLSEAKNTTQEDFLKKYPHPFLVQFIESYINQTDRTNFSMPTLEELIKIETQANQKHITDIIPVVKTNRNPHTTNITVGRINTHDIIIDSQSISKYHGYFDLTSGVYMFSDIGSTNGSKINNHPVNPKEENFIKDGDVISFASVNYTYYLSKTAYEIFKISI